MRLYEGESTPSKPNLDVDNTVNLTLRLQHLMSVLSTSYQAVRRDNHPMNPTPQFSSIGHIADKPCQEAKDCTDLEGELSLVLKVVPRKPARQKGVLWRSLCACCFPHQTRMLCLPLLGKSFLLMHPLNILVNGVSALQPTLWGYFREFAEMRFQAKSQEDVLWKANRQTAVYPIRK